MIQAPQQNFERWFDVFVAYAVRVLALEEELQETNTSSEVALQSLQVSHQEVRSTFQAQRENKKTAPHPQIARFENGSAMY